MFEATHILGWRGGKGYWFEKAPRVVFKRLTGLQSLNVLRYHSLDIRSLQALSQPQGLDALLSAAPPVR